MLSMRTIIFCHGQLPFDIQYSEVARILKNQSAAVRSEDDLECIRNAVDPALNDADVVWASLSARQKLALCKYFELRTVFEEEGQSLCVERRAGGNRNNNHNHYVGGLYILVHGRAIISCGKPSLLVHGDTSCGGGGQIGKVLGRLALPPSRDAHDFFNQAKAGQMSFYHQFVSLHNKQGNDVNIRFDKGSTYIFLPESQSRPFLEKLNASLIAKRVLNDIGMEKLLYKQIHECDENKATKVFRFRSGQILIKEGDDPDRVFFIATGSCLIFLGNDEDQEVHCVGSMLSPSFAGIAPLFGGDDDTEGKQPVSVVAVTDGYAFSFCSLCFLRHFDRMSSKTKLMEAFQCLAKSQLAAWATPTVVEEEKVEEEDAWVTQNDSIDEDETVDSTAPKSGSSNSHDEVEPSPTEKGLASELEVQVEEPTKDDIVCAIPHDAHEPSIDIESMFLNGKLRRSKFLSAIHKTISIDLSRDTATEQNAVLLDVVHNREQWLLDCDKGNILADIMTALSEGCGVDFTKCEGNDPFHNFTIEVPINSNNDSTSMPIRMPDRIPSRMSQMAEKCLGRKRPPGYDDSDPFLKPCPSVVSRKMHGKTLPVVRQIKLEDSIVYDGIEANWMNHLA